MIEIMNIDCKYMVRPNNSIIITDPPYNQRYHYDNYKDNLSEENYIKLLSVLKPPCVVIHYPEETINILPKLLGNVEQVVCWVYNSNTGKQSRLISWFGCKPDFNLVRQEYKNLNDKRIKERIKNGSIGAKLYDWWEVNQVKNTSKEKVNHPCQIPEEIIKNIILTTVPKDWLIIDPFAGSGTTLKVSKDLGYSCLGYEISDEYCNTIKKRLNNE